MVKAKLPELQFSEGAALSRRYTAYNPTPPVPEAAGKPKL
jgi:hypothetical protein